MKETIFYRALVAVCFIAGIGASNLTAQDTPCAATAVSVGSTVSADNTGATPDGPQAGCWFDTTVEADIWFSFVAPASGNVNIETIFTGANDDTQIAVYSTSDGTCSGTFTEVGCNDDNPDDFMAIAEVCGLNPGASYYIQVDGWQGTVGAFDLALTESLDCVTCDPAGCDAGTIADNTPFTLCGAEVGSVDVVGQTFPADADCDATGAIIFSPQPGATGGLAGGFTLFGLTFPYDFDADVNGVMSGNGLDSLHGDWALFPAVYTQFDGLVCSSTTDSLVVTFLQPGEGVCEVCDPSGCEAGSVVNFAPASVCPGTSVDFDVTGISDPASTVCVSEYLLRFTPSAGATGGLTDTLCNPVIFTLAIDPGALPFAIDDDLGGILSSLMINPLRGTWGVRGLHVVDGFICDTTFRQKPITFNGYGEGGCGDQCAPDQNQVDLSIVFDDYSEETSFALYDDAGVLVDSAGPALAGSACFDKSFCLADGCYTFTIYDAFGDGICCDFGAGSYSLTGPDGVIVSGGTFADSETTAFCVGGDDCSVFDTAPVDLTKSFDPVGGVQDRVQVKWFKASPQVRYTDEDAAMCDIKFWAKRNLDPVTGSPVGPAITNPDTILIADAKKTYGNGDPREIFKWPVKFRADGANNNKRAEPNIRYEWQVRCECGHSGDGPESPWSDVKIFNTPDFDPATGIYTPPPGTQWSNDGIVLVEQAKAVATAPAGVKGQLKVADKGLNRYALENGKLAVNDKLQKGRLVRLSNNLDVAKRKVTADGLSLFPNPVADELTVVLTEDMVGTAQVRILDMTGRVVSIESNSLKGQNAAVRIDVSELGTGLYNIEVLVGEKFYRSQFMVK